MRADVIKKGAEGRQVPLALDVGVGIRGHRPETTLIYSRRSQALVGNEVRHVGKLLHLRHLDLSESPQDMLQQVLGSIQAHAARP